MEHLNFKENFNSKLYCNRLTTLRSTESVKEKGLQVGDEVELHISHEPIATATIEEIYSFNITDSLLPSSRNLRILMSMDVGSHFNIAFAKIFAMCGSDITLLLLSVNRRF